MFTNGKECLDSRGPNDHWSVYGNTVYGNARTVRHTFVRSVISSLDFRM